MCGDPTGLGPPPKGLSSSKKCPFGILPALTPRSLPPPERAERIKASKSTPELQGSRVPWSFRPLLSPERGALCPAGAPSGRASFQQGAFGNSFWLEGKIAGPEGASTGWPKPKAIQPGPYMFAHASPPFSKTCKFAKLSEDPANKEPSLFQ